MSGEPGGALGVVRDAEAAIRTALEERLARAVESGGAVERTLRDWNGGLHGEDGSAIGPAAAREANRLTNLVRYRAATGREPPARLRETSVEPFRVLDVPDEVQAVLDGLHASLRDRADVDADLLGARYDEALPDAERRARGQFYTPATVAEGVTRWALAGADREPRVLDPAAGTGTFPLAVYDVLREREPGADPGELHGRIVAVDVDVAALDLAALRLSARCGGARVDDFDRRARSFFDLEPAVDGDAASGDGTGPGRVDAVVGNPPFVRAGDLVPDRAHFRAHLEALGPTGETPYADGERAISGRSDASVYFVTHATRFLRPGGRLAVVLPAKWLESRYGASFRRFLADHYRVNAVVGFGARTFDALVDTVLLLAERRSAAPEGPRDGAVRFVRLDRGEDATTALARLADGGPSEVSAPARDGGSRVIERSQSTFAGARQCSPYLRAPVELLSLLEHPAFVPLGELASVRRGVTTGANRFFLLDREDRGRWGIDPDVLRPAIRSVRGQEGRVLAHDDVDRWLLDVHGVVSADPEPGAEGDPTARAKARLRQAGHGGVVEYVERAEAAGWHEGRTCQARRVWFDLGELPEPDAFVPKLLRERVFTVRNLAGAVPSNAIDCLSVRDGVDPAVLLGVLDSSLARAVMEVWGRDEAGMLQLMTGETRTLPVPDVRALPDAGVARIRGAAGDLDRGDGDGDDRAQAALDAAVVDAFGLDLGAPRIRALRERLLRRRVGDGERVEASRS